MGSHSQTSTHITMVLPKELDNAIKEFESRYDELQEAKKDVAGFLREAAKFIDQNQVSQKRGDLATGTVSLVGGGLSITAGSLMLTAASGGLALPFLIAGAAVGGVGGFGSIANSWVKNGKKTDKIGAADFAISMYNEKVEGIKTADSHLSKLRLRLETELSDELKLEFDKRTEKWSRSDSR